MIEPLELRIAPASVLPYTDFDGDKVVIESSVGNLAGHATFGGTGGQLSLLDLSDPSFKNANITITVTQAGDGDGRVKIGRVNAGNNPLKGFVAPAAGVLEIDCGDLTTGIGTLTIASYGMDNPAVFSGSGADGSGELKGSVGSVKIAGDVAYGALRIGVSGQKVGSVTVGGNLYGFTSTAATTAGAVVISGTVGTVKVGGSIIGGLMQNNGLLGISGTAKSVTIGGDVIGGAGAESGAIGGLDASVGTLLIKGSVIGGPAEASGRLLFESVKSLTIGGDLRGGSIDETGLIRLSKSSGSIVIKGSLIGANAASPPNDLPAGAIVTTAGADVKSITIGHNIWTGRVTGGAISLNGGVSVDGNLGSLTVGGSILGHNGQQALILVKGSGPTKPGDYNALGKLKVGGSVEYAIIEAGQSLVPFPPGTSEDPDAGIGAVTIGGDYYHSSLMAGIHDNGSIGVNNVAGVDSHSAGDPARTSRLGPVVIKGAILDDTQSAFFSGFEAGKIVSITVGGKLVYKSGDGEHFFDAEHYVVAREL